MSDQPETPRQRWDRENNAMYFAGGRALWKRNLTPQAIIARMAGILVDLSAANDNATESDLIAAGFSAQEIHTYRDRAIAEAARRAPGLRGCA